MVYNDVLIALLDVFIRIAYTLNQVFCCKQSFVYLQFYLYMIGKIVNKQRIECGRIPGLSFNQDKHGDLVFSRSQISGSS